MDFGTAVVTVIAAAAVLLPRLPAFTAEGREQARIQLDVGLWTDMPHGDVRDSLGAEIEERTTAMLNGRTSGLSFSDATNVGLRWAGAGWVLLVASTAVSGDGAWVPHVLLALQVGGLISGGLGGLMILTCVLILLCRGFKRAWLGVVASRHEERPAS